MAKFWHNFPLIKWINDTQWTNERRRLRSSSPPRLVNAINNNTTEPNMMTPQWGFVYVQHLSNAVMPYIYIRRPTTAKTALARKQIVCGQPPTASQPQSNNELLNYLIISNFSMFSLSTLLFIIWTWWACREQGNGIWSHRAAAPQLNQSRQKKRSAGYCPCVVVAAVHQRTWRDPSVRQWTMKGFV